MVLLRLVYRTNQIKSSYSWLWLFGVCPDLCCVLVLSDLVCLFVGWAIWSLSWSLLRAGKAYDVQFTVRVLCLCSMGTGKQ